MKVAAVSLLCSASSVHALVLSNKAAAQVTPTQKVLQMMSELHSKGEKMMDEEQKMFATYTEWADDQSKKLAFDIEDAATTIEELTAAISKYESDAKHLGRAITDLEKEIAELNADKKQATDERNKQHKEYLALSKDYAESVDALGRAIQVVSEQQYSRPEAEVYLQRMARHYRGMETVLAALHEQSEPVPSEGVGAPGVNAYEGQSGGIVDMLEGLLKKFKGELSDVETQESKEAHDYNLVLLDLTNSIKEDTKDRDEKTRLRAQKKAASAKAQGDLAATKKAKAEDETLKKEIETTFQAKRAMFEENQKVRVEEIKAIAKAEEIISSPDVSGGYKEHVNFLQLRSGVSSSTRQQAVALLKRRAAALGSSSLATLASALSENGPFVKVIEMIGSLLDRLKEEAAAEADHKAWCDEQLHANQQKRKEKTAKVNQLSTTIQGLTAAIREKGATISKLIEEQVELAQAMTEATDLRTKEKAENSDAIADAKVGAEAVKRAIVVLKEFYEKQEASFIQQGQVPEMSAYKGMQAGKGGIIGMLEVIASDFLRLQAETEAAEKTSATDHAQFMEDSQASKKQKHDEEFKLKLAKDEDEFQKSQAAKDLEANEDELAKAGKYYEYLKPTCVSVKTSWSERVAKRNEELAALKDAYNILEKKSIE